MTERACPRGGTAALTCIKRSAFPLTFLGCGHGGSAVRIQETDTAGDDEEHLLALEPGERAAHGFDRQPEVIGDVLPAHRQCDGLPGVADLGQALAPTDEEGSDLLLRRTSPQQQ